MAFEDVLRHHQRVNALARSLIGRPAFDDIHVWLPDPARPESGFVRATSWLYCLYFEAGRATFTYLRRLGESYGVVRRHDVDHHVEAVRCLRTELHHNLGYADSDQAARMSAEVWRRQACGTAVPATDEQWALCYDRLTEDATLVMRAIEDVVRRIESDAESAQDYRNEWTRRLSRSWPAASFDPVIEDAKCRIGRQALNVVAFRNRHIDRWRKQMELLEDSFDFTREATLLVEKSLLDEDAIVLPITGRDLMERLSLGPGQLVGKLLAEARRVFEQHQYGPDELLAHVEQFHRELGIPHPTSG